MTLSKEKSSWFEFKFRADNIVVIGLLIGGYATFFNMQYRLGKVEDKVTIMDSNEARLTTAVEVLTAIQKEHEAHRPPPFEPPYKTQKDGQPQ